MKARTQPVTLSPIPIVSPKQEKAWELKERLDADLTTLKEQYWAEGSDTWESSSPEYRAKVEARMMEYGHDYDELLIIMKPMPSIIDVLRREISQRSV